MPKKKCVKVYLDDYLLDWCRVVADKDCDSVSAVIRDAVRNYRLLLSSDTEVWITAENGECDE